MPSFRPIIASWTKGTIQDHYFKEAKVPPGDVTARDVSRSPSGSRKDRVTAAAQKLGYVSRAAFKLKEIQQKHKIIKQGGWQLVLPSASTPGDP
jgi:hypothetical protein